MRDQESCTLHLKASYNVTVFASTLWISFELLIYKSSDPLSRWEHRGDIKAP